MVIIVGVCCQRCQTNLVITIANEVHIRIEPIHIIALKPFDNLIDLWKFNIELFSNSHFFQNELIRLASYLFDNFERVDSSLRYTKSFMMCLVPSRVMNDTKSWNSFFQPFTIFSSNKNIIRGSSNQIRIKTELMRSRNFLISGHKS